MFRRVGSAILPAMPEGLLAAMWTLLIELIVPRSYMDTLLQHPNAYHTFAFLALTLLVFRTNVAYNRFWECCTSVTVMGGMWGDAFTMAITMDELINTNKREYGEAGAAWLEKRRRHQMLMARRYSLCHALALQYLRRDDCLKNLVPSDGRHPNVPMGAGAFGGMEQPTSRADPEWQQLEVLGGLTESEIRSLESSPDRVGYIFSQIMHLNAQRRCDGGLGTDAPVLSRYWSCLSAGMSGMRQARKVEDIPFPWPYTQAVALCTHLFALTFPLVLAHFANCGSVSCASPNYWMGPFLAFVTVTSFAALDQVAVALEDPFVHPPNDLPANALQAAFNNRLNTILDAVRRPADALTTNPQLVCDLDRLPEGDEKYWGEFAELEATDVKLATVNFLGQWRKYTTKHERPAHNFRSKSMSNIATPGLVMLSSGRGKLKTRLLEVEAVGGVKKSSSDPNLTRLEDGIAAPPPGAPPPGRGPLGGKLGKLTSTSLDFLPQFPKAQPTSPNSSSTIGDTLNIFKRSRALGTDPTLSDMDSPIGTPTKGSPSASPSVPRRA